MGRHSSAVSWPATQRSVRSWWPASAVRCWASVGRMTTRHYEGRARSKSTMTPAAEALPLEACGALSSAPLKTAEITLSARGRFDLRATVLSYGYYQLPPYRWEDGPRQVLRRAEQLPDGSVYLLEVRPAPGGVRLRVTGKDADDLVVLAPLAARMRKALRLDEDFREFHRLCRREPWLRPIARLGLGRMLRGTSLFEDLVKAIAWTNT